MAFYAIEKKSLEGSELVSTCGVGLAENARFFIKFRILQTLSENLLILRKKGILPKFQ